MGDRDPGPKDDRPFRRVRWSLGTDDEVVGFLREVAAGLLLVVLVGRVSEPVRPSWVEGRAAVRIPYLGRVRLVFARVGH